MFLAGMGGFLHELFYQGVERPFILTACLALMGLPVLLGADRTIQVKKKGEE